jgi:hypothetical protein
VIEPVHQDPGDRVTIRVDDLDAQAKREKRLRHLVHEVIAVSRHRLPFGNNDLVFSSRRREGSAFKQAARWARGTAG